MAYMRQERPLSPTVEAIIAAAREKEKEQQPPTLAEKISAAVKEKKPKAFRYEITTSAPLDVGKEYVIVVESLTPKKKAEGGT